MTNEARMPNASIPRWLWLPILGCAVLTCALIGICASSDGCDVLSVVPHVVGLLLAVVCRNRLSLGLIALAGSALMATISQTAAADQNRHGDWRFDNAVGSMICCVLNYGVVAVVGFAITLLSDKTAPRSGGGEVPIRRI